MKITVRSRLGVYHELTVPTDLDEALAALESEEERRRVERGLEALVLAEQGASYGEIAQMLDLSKATAYRRVQDARRRYRRAAVALGVELLE